MHPSTPRRLRRRPHLPLPLSIKMYLTYCPHLIPPRIQNASNSLAPFLTATTTKKTSHRCASIRSGRPRRAAGLSADIALNNFPLLLLAHVSGIMLITPCPSARHFCLLKLLMFISVCSFSKTRLFLCPSTCNACISNRSSQSCNSSSHTSFRTSTSAWPSSDTTSCYLQRQPRNRRSSARTQNHNKLHLFFCARHFLHRIGCSCIVHLRYTRYGQDRPC